MGKIAANADLTIVRGPNNTIEITGYGDQLQENQAALLKDVREFDTGANYVLMA